MEVRLARTWAEIGAHLAWEPDPLSAVQIVNLVAPRSWKFSFSFDAEGKTVLDIRSQPPLELSDLQLVAGGLIPELLFADFMDAMGAGGSLTTRPRQRWVQADPENLMRLVPNGEITCVDRLRLTGYFDSVLPGDIQHRGKVTERLYESTRLGSHEYRHSSLAVEWHVLGHSTSYAPVSRIAQVRAQHTPNFATEFMVGNGQGEVIAVTSPGIPSTRLYHSDFGRIEPSDYVGDLRCSYPGPSPWLIEFTNRKLRLDVLARLGPRGDVRDTLLRMYERLRQLANADAFREHVAVVHELEREHSASALAERQAWARNSPYVYAQDRALMCVPTCENEVVALFMKLDAMAALPVPLFSVLEYTSRAGIDSLANIKLAPGEAQAHLAPVEFEYLFESFIAHGHPESQVRVVVCWDFGEEDPELPEEATLEKVGGREWLYLYRRGEYGVHVLRMNRLPTITIEPWR